MSDIIGFSISTSEESDSEAPVAHPQHTAEAPVAQSGIKRPRGRPIGATKKIRTREKSSMRLKSQQRSKEAASPTYEKFSKEEMNALLDCLKKHGTNLEELGREQRKTRKFSARLSTLQNLENWTAALHQTQSPFLMEELSMALNTISECEPHPPPELCEGIDFKKMYQYLALVTSGTPPCDMPAENMALLSASLDMVRHHRTELPFTKALHRQISELKSIDINSAMTPKPIKTYSRKNKQPIKVEGELINARLNPLKINEDLLTLSRDDVVHLPLKNEFKEKIRCAQGGSTLFFQSDGAPLERELVLNALRLEERPVNTIYRCTGEDVFVFLPFLERDSLQQVHFSSIVANPKPLAVVSVDVKAKKDSTLITSIIPASKLSKKVSQPNDETHVISIDSHRAAHGRPYLVHKLPVDPAIRLP
ncbi:Hypothetical predicted protein [Cloeon dipterum]|uniref:Uncharacterized protein n=1 Tax=Cloeon dipterum TaxID=197152 RepID=A0A8S1DJD4_9INSE|nr:Hypothetical predicted protein [Cloeon dipterum]